MAEIQVIGSGSSGNCYCLKTSSQYLLIEGGMKLLEVKKACDFQISRIAGCLFSHVHGDHAAYINDYAKAGITCYSSQAATSHFPVSHRIKPIQLSINHTIGEFTVKAFPVEHDVECYGYLIHHPETGLIVFITDTMYSPYMFANVNHIMIEANYLESIIEQRVESGQTDHSLKDRIINSHMGFETVIDFISLTRLHSPELKTITLLHLSRNNSDKRIMKERIAAEFGMFPYIAENGVIVPLNTF